MAEESASGYLRGVIVGLLFGAVTALLLTPKRGEELRHELTEGASKLKDKAGELGETVADTARDLKERSGELTANMRSSGSNALQEAAYYAEDVQESAPDRVQDTVNGAVGDVQPKDHDVMESV